MENSSRGGRLSCARPPAGSLCLASSRPLEKSDAGTIYIWLKTYHPAASPVFHKLQQWLDVGGREVQEQPNWAASILTNWRLQGEGGPENRQRQ